MTTLLHALITIILGLIGFSVVRGDQMDDLYRKYDDTVCKVDFPTKGDLSWVTPELRQAFIQKARGLLEKRAIDPSKGSLAAPNWEVLSADRVMLELGDKAFLEAYWHEYHQGMTGVCPSVQMLPYLADDLYHGDTRYFQAGDVVVASIMDKSTDTMYRILKTYPCFPAATRAWAGSYGYDDYKGEKRNQLMREWW